LTDDRIVAPMRTAFALLLILGSACNDSSGPNAAVVGRYEATVFEIEPGGDILAAGGSLELELFNDSTTTGQLHVPAEFNDGEAFNADLTGRYEVTGDTLHFTHGADTFVRDVPWQILSGSLVASAEFGGVVVSVTLQRQ